MALPLRQLRAFLLKSRRAVRTGLQSMRGPVDTAAITRTFAAARVRRVQKYGQVEQLGMHAKTRLEKHAALASKRGGERLEKSFARQTQYVRHVQKRMKRTLKANNAASPYGEALISRVKPSKRLVRRTA